MHSAWKIVLWIFAGIIAIHSLYFDLYIPEGMFPVETSLWNPRAYIEGILAFAREMNRVAAEYWILYMACMFLVFNCVVLLVVMIFWLHLWRSRSTVKSRTEK